jgi:hypothetical protein
VGYRGFDSRDALGWRPTADRPMTDDDTTTRRTISESADKIVLKTSVKRGTGTRDQDKLDVKIKGDDPGETVGRLADTLAAIQEQGVAEFTRGIQPGASEVDRE